MQNRSLFSTAGSQRSSAASCHDEVQEAVGFYFSTFYVILVYTFLKWKEN